MSQESFDIYFAGEILPERSADSVRQWLGRQFGLQGEALERLFSGTPVRIKQGVDMDTAGKYRAAFRQAGALIEVRPTATATTPPAAADTAAEPELLPANTGSLEDCTAAPAPAPVPDISHMAMDPVGIDLDDTPEAAPAAIAADMALDAPGVDLDEAASPPPADIDTSHLSAEPANTGDLSEFEQAKAPQEIGDISALSLSDD